ncbi:MAG TPA: glycosyltransferase family 2 protein [Spirillospora sp.]|nr:glycosyltransferase family 2 protein [Spirillospora sp.]
MTTAPCVYIAVLNWHGADKTIACLESLRTLSYVNHHVIVVDNASRDDSVARITSAFPDVDLIVSDENLGYAGGNVLALKHAQARDDGTGLLWVLNNDARVLPDTLKAFVDAYHQHGEALYGGVTIIQDGEQDEWRVTMRVWENDKPRQLRGVPYRELYASTAPRVVEALSGSSLLIPLAVVRQHGFIDPSFFMYAEDVDYCFRLRRAGINNVLVPEAVTIHTDGTSHKAHSRNHLQPVITYYRARNKIVVRRRYFGARAYVKAIGVQAAYALGWLLLYFRRGIVGPRCAYFTILGIRDAIRGRMGKVYAPEDYLANS